MRNLSVIGILCWSSFAFAGVELTYEDSGGMHKGKQETTILVEGKAARVETMGLTMIFRPEKNDLVLINKEKMSYSVFDEAAIAQLSAMVGNSQDMLEETLKSLPPEQRKEMMKSMPAGGLAKATEVQVKKTGRKAKVNGYNTRIWEAYTGGEKTSEMFVASYKSVKGAGPARSAMKAMTEFSAKLADQIGGGVDMITAMRGLDGLAVKTIHYSDAMGNSTSILKSVRKKRTKKTDFAIPRSYKKSQLF